MSRWSAIPALAWRESRTARRRLLLYMSSISLGVAALVAIDAFATNVQTSIREQARALMGGDVQFTSNARFPDALNHTLDSIATHGTPVARLVKFASMAVATRSGGTRLVQVQAVSANYPFYGEVTTEPARQWERLQTGTFAVVDPALLIALDARVGDTLQVGYAKFAIIGTLTNLPGDPGISSVIGPRVVIPERFVPETQLLGFGSRASYEALVKLPPTVASARWVAPLRPAFQAQHVRVVTVVQRERSLSESTERLADFLGIVGLIALLLGGIGVASGVHAFVTRKVETVAVLRCLGATNSQIMAIYVAQAGVMGLIGASAGAALGVAIQFALPLAFRGLLPVDVHVVFSPGAVLLGLGIGLWVALAFALHPLLALRRVSPLQALRHDAEALDAQRRRDLPTHLVSALLVVSVLVLAIERAGGVRRGLLFAAGIGASLLALWLSASGLSALARRLVRPRWPYVVRQGIANLHRPANQTRAVVLALGFGAFLVSTLYLVRTNLLAQLDISAAASKGNLIFYDVQDDQRPGLDSILRAEHVSAPQYAAIVTMKIAAINGQTLDTWAPSHGMPISHWTVRREYRSTYRDTLVATEQIVAGHWFTASDRADPIPGLSLERDVAEQLHVHVGDTLTWDVQGIRVTARLTSLREVNWGRFEPNFFAVFEPRALAGAPQQFVTVVSAPNDSMVARLQRRTVARYPNIASVDLSLIRRTVGTIVARVSIAVRFLALFSFAMGIPVLLSAVAATRRDRLREGVLLKTLGATRAQIARILLAEYALLGALGACAGMLLSFAGAWGIVTFVFHGTFTPAILPALVIAGIMMTLAIAIGLLTSRDVFRETPMAALREL